MIQLAMMSEVALQSIEIEMGVNWFRHLHLHLPSCFLLRDIRM